MDKLYLKQLLRRISKDSDEEAARALFNLFHPKLVRYAVFYTSSIHDANDIVSDVFIKLFNRLKRIDEIRDIQFYLYKSVKNQCLTYLKKKPISTSIDEIDWETGSYLFEIKNPENELIRNELSMKIEEAINALPTKRKLIYKMVVIDGLKYKEAAEILDLSVKTIENHLGLAVKDLRREITAYLKSNDVNIPELHALYKN